MGDDDDDVDGSVRRAQEVDSWFDDRGLNCLVRIASGHRGFVVSQLLRQVKVAIIRALSPIPCKKWGLLPLIHFEQGLCILDKLDMCGLDSVILDKRCPELCCFGQNKWASQCHCLNYLS